MGVWDAPRPVPVPVPSMRGAPEMKPILFNGDCNFLFATDYSGGAGRYTAAVIHQYVDQLARSGVTHFIINVNGQKPWYLSDTLEHVLSGYTRGDRQYVRQVFPALGPDFNQAQLDAALARQTQMLDRFLDLAEAGVDWVAEACGRCRQHGIKPWISIRMNDAH